MSRKLGTQWAWLITTLWVLTLIASYLDPHFKVPVIFDILMPLVGSYLLGLSVGKKGVSVDEDKGIPPYTVKSAEEVSPYVETPVWEEGETVPSIQEMASPPRLPEPKLHNQRIEMQGSFPDETNGEDFGEGTEARL